MSALSRIAVDNHRLLSLGENDTVILSSRIIPGNEKAIYRMIDHLFRRRVLVYYEGSLLPRRFTFPATAARKEMKILLQARKAEIFHSRSRRISADVPARGARCCRSAPSVDKFSCLKAALRSNSPPMAAPTNASRSPPAASAWTPAR